MIAWCTRSWPNRFLHFAVVAICCLALMACALFKQDAKTAIEVAIAACVAEHPEITTEPEMAKACQYATEFGPIVEQLLGARKRGLVRMATQRSTPPPADAVVLVLVTPIDAGVKDATK